MKPEIRIAWRDGASLAFQVVGDGPRDLLYLPGIESNVDLMWEVPAYRDFLTRLSSFGRLITHDRRGLGCSDRLPAGLAATLEQGRDDLLAVLDAVGSRRPIIFAVQEAAFPVLSFAATHPERVERLVLFGASPSLSWSEDLPHGWTDERWDEELQRWSEVTSLSHFLDAHARTVAPSLEGDDDARRALRRLLMGTESLGAAIAEARMLSRVDLRSILPSISTQTLVIRRDDDASVPAASSRFLADHLARGEYLEIPGRDAIPWVGDQDPIFEALRAFMDVEDPAPTSG